MEALRISLWLCAGLRLDLPPNRVFLSPSFNPTIMGWKCTVASRSRTAFEALRPIPRFCISIAAAVIISPAILGAQTPSGIGRQREIFAGSELATYLRYMQLTGGAEHFPWSLRPFSPSQIDSLISHDSAGPWSASYSLGTSLEKARRGWAIIPPAISARINTGFPYGSNDGPIWAGRGLTTAASAGLALRAGALSITLAPVAFRAENYAFELLGGSAGCPPACSTLAIDRPERFGSHAYQRLDPGNSSIQVELAGGTMGVSTANEHWGPLDEYPFLLGENAPGFLHAFFGTARPLNALIGRFSGRVIYGRLEQSAFSPVQGSEYFVSQAQSGRVRFASGALIVFEPRGFNGLEIGVARFIHSAWPSTGIPKGYLKKPFEAAFKSSLSAGGIGEFGAVDNQLASAFFRWTFSNSGMEVYGEYGKDDHNYDFRDLVQEPDHDRAYALGFRKVFGYAPSGFSALRAELINFSLPPLARLGRGEGQIYEHGVLRQGHTNRGQLLGADVGYGTAAGSTLSYDRYDRSGRWTWKWIRDVRADAGFFYTNGIVNPHATDVIYGLGAERMRFGRTRDVTTSLTLMRDFNRNFSHDVNNLNASVSFSLPNRF